MSSANDGTSESSATPQCCNCRFWKPGQGICRRYPPSIPKSGVKYDEFDFAVFPMWPLTDDDEWCGEHKPKESERDE